MNKILLLLSVTFILSLSEGDAQSDEVAIKQSITKLFDGLSFLDEAMIRGELTDDFQLLEDGLVWNADSLVGVLHKVDKATFSRVNRFEFLKVEQKGNVAWVSYFNYASVAVKDRKFDLKWLESAVLLKTRNRWRIAFLHSTRIKQLK